MSHPYTARAVGFRLFDGASFGELSHCNWDFDGTESDVRSFAQENLADDGQDIESVREVCDGTFDVLLSDGTDYRVYTQANDQ